jgi:hypothetical protein
VAGKTETKLETNGDGPECCPAQFLGQKQQLPGRLSAFEVAMSLLRF